jgi:hypothetical protein
MASREATRFYGGGPGTGTRRSTVDSRPLRRAARDTPSITDFRTHLVRSASAEFASRARWRSLRASLDYDEIRGLGTADLPSQTFDFDGCSTRLTALPVHPDSRGEFDGRIGIGPASTDWVIRSAEAIRDLLDKKARQCKEVDAPLVVAVLNWATFPTLKEMEHAVFGSTAVRYELHDRDSVRSIRNTDGYWHPGPPPRGSRVSAVIFGERLHPSRVAAELPSL